MEEGKDLHSTSPNATHDTQKPQTKGQTYTRLLVGVHRVYFLIFLLFLAVLYDMQDFSSLTRDCTGTPAVGAQSLNHWTAREVTHHVYFNAL